MARDIRGNRVEGKESWKETERQLKVEYLRWLFPMRGESGRKNKKAVGY